MSVPRMVQPGAWLGLLGGGQQGRMFTMAAQSMGYRVAVLDPGDHSPAGTVADRHIRADYTDARGLEALASLCKGVTTEFENVPAQALEYLSSHCRVTPDARAVAIAQDRIREKAFVEGVGIETAPYMPLLVPEDVNRALDDLFPGILKVSRLGYDGKGQARVAGRAEARRAFDEMKRVPCVLEKLLPLVMELSVVIVRNDEGDTATWPLAENIHANGILDSSIVPARVSPEIADRARAVAIAIADGLSYVGVLCVEFFLLEGNRLAVNEIAPRPHNSGHYTIDACVTSQFEQQVRVLAALPLGDTTAHCPAVMLNLLGEVWTRGEPDWTRVLEHPRAKLHLYGKQGPRRGRKMGHVTCLGDTLEDALNTAAAIRRDLQF